MEPNVTPTPMPAAAALESLAELDGSLFADGVAVLVETTPVGPIMEALVPTDVVVPEFAIVVEGSLRGRDTLK